MVWEHLRQFMFRRGNLPMGDVYDVVERVRMRCDEILGHNITADASKKMDAAEKMDRFLKLVLEESDAQWQRIEDRRVSGSLYALFGLLGGLVLGKLL
jgi:hypothetical protein